MDLTLTLQHLSGIAVSEAQKLTKLGLRTIADLLYYFPKEHLAFKSPSNALGLLRQKQEIA
jgi:RecG-like helicase